MTKEKSCLITTSIIGAMDWYLIAPDTIIKDEKGGDGKTTWKKKALQDLKDKLGRVKTPFPEAARRGVEFEKMVYKHAGNNPHDGSDLFQKVCMEVKGMEFYQKGGMDIMVVNNKCYIYGKYDAISKDKTLVKDIKTTGNYKVGKYLNGIQHKLYCLMSGATHFEYIVAEWDEYPNLKAIHKEVYKVKDRGMLGNEVLHKIEEFLDLLKDLNLWELYRETFCLY